MKVLNTILDFIRTVYQKEPVRITALVTGVVVFVFAKVGIVVPEQSILTALAYVFPILLGGEVVRTQVKPA